MPSPENFGATDSGRGTAEDAFARFREDYTSPRRLQASVARDPGSDTSRPASEPPLSQHDLEIINEGMIAGHKLAVGKTPEFATDYAKKLNDIAAIKDPLAQEKEKSDYITGLAAADPTDVHLQLSPTGNKFDINLTSEIWANQALKLQDWRGSDSFKDAQGNRPQTPQEAAQILTNTIGKAMEDVANSTYADGKKPTDAEIARIGADFIADFNRRRLEKDSLVPDFIASTDSSTGKVKITYVGKENN